MKKLYAILLLSSMGAFAQTPLLMENFDYTAGDALTTQGWTAHSAATTNPILVTNPGLTFTNYYGSAIGNAAGVNNTGQDVNKVFPEVTSGSVYISFLVSATASTTDEYFFNLGATTIGTAFRGRLFIQPNTDTTKFTLGFSFNSSAPQASDATLLNFGQTYLMVVKYTIVDGAANDTVSLYAFAQGDSFGTEPATPLIGPLTGTAADVNPGSVALRQFNANQRITVDAIRVNTVWQVDSSLAGTKDNALVQAKLYPNPVKGSQLFVSGIEGDKTVEIFDITGKKVFSAATNNDSFDVSSLNNGVYMAKITAGNASATRKLVVAK
ncbi:MAG: T9SS type A sorting domain-containing protein [Flavobacterium sp.]